MLDKTAGAKGENADLWIAFSDAALALLHKGEDPYALMAHITRVTESYWDTTLGPVAATREP